MLWYKHFTNNSTQNSAFMSVRAELGVEGYGRLILLLECLAGGADTVQTPPTTRATPKLWAHTLDTKPKNLDTFLKYCAKVGIISFQKIDDEIEVTLLNYRKLLTKSALSSDKRSTSGRLEERRRDKSNNFSPENHEKKDVYRGSNGEKLSPAVADEHLSPLNFKSNDEIENAMKGNQNV